MTSHWLYLRMTPMEKIALTLVTTRDRSSVGTYPVPYRVVIDPSC